MSHSNTPPVKNGAPRTARSSSLRFVSAAEHQTVEQYFKTGRTKPRKHLPRSNLSWNTCQDFLKIPSFWEAALETERSRLLLKGHLSVYSLLVINSILFCLVLVFLYFLNNYDFSDQVNVFTDGHFSFHPNNKMVNKPGFLPPLPSSSSFGLCVTLNTFYKFVRFFFQMFLQIVLIIYFIYIIFFLLFLFFS